MAKNHLEKMWYEGLLSSTPEKYLGMIYDSFAGAVYAILLRSIPNCEVCDNLLVKVFHKLYADRNKPLRLNLTTTIAQKVVLTIIEHLESDRLLAMELGLYTESDIKVYAIKCIVQRKTNNN